MSPIETLTHLRQYQANGQRAPHKPLLILLALGQLTNSGSSELEWSSVESRLGQLLAEFGTPTKAGTTSAAYPFTRLRADGVWQLSRSVPDDNVGPLREAPISGHFTPDIETYLRNSPDELARVAREIVESQFPLTIAPDVLTAVGLDPDVIFAAPGTIEKVERRRRSASWREQIILSWDRSCAFCGFDGSLMSSPVAIEAAHVRWFNHDGPDDLDNGLALCSLHHKLLDRGVLGFVAPDQVAVSASFTAVSSVGRQVYDLHGLRLRPRRGTALPAPTHIEWHTSQVFKQPALSA